MKVGATAKFGPNDNPALRKYIEKASAAICSAIGLWQVQAKFSGLKINGPTAMGPPGCLQGPPLAATITAMSPRANMWETRMSSAIASAVSSAWADYQASVMVPGLPWYPAFAAFPGPMAPPMPNVPTPLLMLPQIGGAAIQEKIRGGIKKSARSLANASTVADAIADGFLIMFMPWVSTVLVHNVLGKGPVPSFAPPYVPVGPVVMGDNIPVPGHLL
jgi:hypothetical protein